MRLLHDAQLLFDRVLTARPGTPPQRIDLNALCCAGAHLAHHRHRKLKGLRGQDRTLTVVRPSAFFQL